jgi:hypothetical protein
MPQHITDSIKTHNRINHRDVDSLGCVPLSRAERGFLLLPLGGSSRAAMRKRRNQWADDDRLSSRKCSANSALEPRRARLLGHRKTIFSRLRCGARCITTPDTSARSLTSTTIVRRQTRKKFFFCLRSLNYANCLALMVFLLLNASEADETGICISRH